MKKLKIGIIGNGKSTHRYNIPFIEASGLYNIVVILKNSDRLFEMPYPKEYNYTFDKEHFYSYDLDIVLIATPHNTHYQLAQEVLKRGINCIVEKPMCLSVQQCDHLYELAKENNVLLVPYQNRRYDSDFLTIKQILENEEEYGEIIEIESNHSYYREYPIILEGDVTDGMVFGHAVHFIDQIVSIYGKPNEIISDCYNAKASFLKQTLSNVDDTYSIILIYEKIRVKVNFLPMAHYQKPSWIISTTKYGFVKQERDQQEKDLKEGIYPFDTKFGIDDDQIKVYENNMQCEKTIKNIQLNYTQYYIDLYNHLFNKSKVPVTESEAKNVIAILEGIVNPSLC